MHGRTRLLVLTLALALIAPAAAQAAPMPAGTYDVTLTGGTVNLGNGLLPALPLTSGTTFEASLGTDPYSTAIGLTVADGPITGNVPGFAITGNVSLTITGAGVTVNPATGSATAVISFYGNLGLTATGIVTSSGSCSLGSQNAPVTLNLTTDQGSAWDPATGAFSMADRTFSFALPDCSPDLLDGLIGLLLGSTGAGDNLAILNGTAIRRPDPPTTTTAGTTSPPSQPATSGPSVTTQPLVPGTPTTPGTTVKRCVVPKLVGKTLTRAKRLLKKAGCKAGKTKSKASKKKKGRVIKQRYRAGKKLKLGAKVPLTVSRGPAKKTRR